MQICVEHQNWRVRDLVSVIPGVHSRKDHWIKIPSVTSSEGRKDAFLCLLLYVHGLYNVCLCLPVSCHFENILFRCYLNHPKKQCYGVCQRRHLSLPSQVLCVTSTNIFGQKLLLQQHLIAHQSVPEAFPCNGTPECLKYRHPGQYTWSSLGEGSDPWHLPVGQKCFVQATFLVRVAGSASPQDWYALQ